MSHFHAWGWPGNSRPTFVVFARLAGHVSLSGLDPASDCVTSRSSTYGRLLISPAFLEIQNPLLSTEVETLETD
jgi:hypothetical protein